MRRRLDHGFCPPSPVKKGGIVAALVDGSENPLQAIDIAGFIFAGTEPAFAGAKGWNRVARSLKN